MGPFEMKTFCPSTNMRPVIRLGGSQSLVHGGGGQSQASIDGEPWFSHRFVWLTNRGRRGRSIRGGKQKFKNKPLRPTKL